MDLTKLVYLTDDIAYDPCLPKGIALYRYEATESEELTLEEGDIVDIMEEADDGWWHGSKIVKPEKGKSSGIFPYNYIRKLSKTEYDQIKNLLISGNKNVIIQNHGYVDPNQNPTSQPPSQSSTSQQSSQQSQQTHSSLSYSDIQIDNDTKTYHNHASLSDPLEKRSSGTGATINYPNSNNNGNIGGSYEENYTQLQRLSIQQPKPQSSVTIKLNDVAKEGYLIKKGHIRKNWNVRWFTLKRNVLTYAKSPSEPKLSGTIALTRDTEIDIATSMKRTNCFQIKIPIDGNKDKPFIFICSAHSADDMESWIRNLNQAKNI
ncbi:hypothetical protein DLAC_02443 [Tieghemostelium lacteum]|uniref:Pleckstrin (PH) domain-containing protein n=1 Tax=Tieghemostelium lacteum TaxID=361077 RepID=A0A152A2I6_TIELA|nr:hypothetical protein DLAC_02443 [Tieghemostelium lacteum]|eukprot:KYR00448.1 hypothetical protein DLAC_02443 [Tieghemostelium lacteum]